MSTERTSVTVSTSSGKTEELGRKLGSKLRGGEVLILRSDLGGGKTTFVRGLAAGMGSEDVVASPSFTISRLYVSPTLDLHHYDFYRLTEPGLMAGELRDVIADPRNVVVVEWAAIIQDVLPEQYIEIDISVTAEDERHISVSIPERYAYLEGAVA